MKNKPERSVEEIVEEFRYQLEGANAAKDGGAVATKYVQPIAMWLTQTIQAERQKRDEMVEAERKAINDFCEKHSKIENMTEKAKKSGYWRAAFGEVRQYIYERSKITQPNNK